MDVLIGIGFLSTLGERIAEVAIKPALDFIVKGNVPESVRVWVYCLVCAVPGAVIVWYWGKDGFAMLGFDFPGNVGLILTALVAGFGSNFVHETFAFVREQTRR